MKSASDVSLALSIAALLASPIIVSSTASAQAQSTAPAEDLLQEVVVIGSRGQHFACLERVLNLSGSYAWERVGPGDSAQAQEVSDFLARRTRFDEDMWILELDIAAPERFIAETTPTG